MTDKVKQRLCELSAVDYQNLIFRERLKEVSKAEWIGILIKAMWAINREKGKLKVSQDIDNDYYVVSSLNTLNTIPFLKDKYNNSEQQALAAALEYIINQPVAESATNADSEH